MVTRRGCTFRRRERCWAQSTTLMSASHNKMRPHSLIGYVSYVHIHADVLYISLKTRPQTIHVTHWNGTMGVRLGTGTSCNVLLLLGLLLYITLTLGRWARTAKIVPDWDILGSKLPWWTADYQPGCLLQQSHVRLNQNPFLYAGCVVNNVPSAYMYIISLVYETVLFAMQKFRIKGSNTHCSQERGI